MFVILWSLFQLKQELADLSSEAPPAAKRPKTEVTPTSSSKSTTVDKSKSSSSSSSDSKESKPRERIREIEEDIFFAPQVSDDRINR